MCVCVCAHMVFSCAFLCARTYMSCVCCWRWSFSLWGAHGHRQAGRQSGLRHTHTVVVPVAHFRCRLVWSKFVSRSTRASFDLSTVSVARVSTEKETGDQWVSALTDGGERADRWRFWAHRKSNLARFSFLAGNVSALGLAVTSIVPLQPDIMEVRFYVLVLVLLCLCFCMFEHSHFLSLYKCFLTV